MATVHKQETMVGSWIVQVRKVVLCTVVCENCTREEAEAGPFGFAVEEHEDEMVDWDVRSVTANT